MVAPYRFIRKWQALLHSKMKNMFKLTGVYRQKFDTVLDILKSVISITKPDASFYL